MEMDMKLFSVFVCFLSGIYFQMLYGAPVYPGRAEDKIAVQKCGDKVFIRSWFSPDKDVLISMNKGVNRQINYLSTGLIPASAPLKKVDLTSGEIFHYCQDDSCPLKIISTYIGANHGCSDARELTIPRHGLKTKDIGSKWKDSRGDIYYIIKIVDGSKIQVLGENKGSNGIWRFNRMIKPGKFVSADGKKQLEIKRAVLTQMIPAVRIKKQEYLVDGKTPLEDGKPVICDYLDIVEGYEIVAPDSLLEYIKRNPGKSPDFTAPEAEALLVNKNTYQFQPRGVCVVDNEIIPGRDFSTYQASPVMTMQLNKLNNYDTHEYYIPKTKAFENAGIKYDFNSIQDFTVPIKLSLSFSKGNNNIDPENPPNRFIQFLGKKENGKNKRKIAYAIGIVNDYGLGDSEERIKNVDEMLFIYKSYKTYPKVLDQKAGMLKAGTSLKSRGYRQYFDPQAHNKATCVYWNRQGKVIRLYMDYHQSVDKDVIKLPEEFTGMKVKIIEKSPSIELLTNNTVPASGIAVSVKGKQAYIVLQLEK
jgi:hypothetical protein